MAIEDTIDFLQDTVNDALRTARETTSRIQNNFAPPLSKPSLSYTLQKPVIEPPPNFGDLLPGDTTGETVAFLDGEVEKWLEQYFPELTACLRTKPEEWLCGILTGQKPFGLDKSVFEAEWHISRDRETRARESAVQQIRVDFSNRGFSLPPGALVGAVAREEERMSDAIADVNRAQTIRAEEIKLDLMKFAEEQAIRLKLGIMQALADFYRQWLDIPNKDLEAGRIKAMAYSSLTSALANYYQVELGFEQIRLRAAESRMEGGISNDRNVIAASNVNNSADALATAVRAFGDAAAAAANAQSALQAEIASATAGGGNP